MLRQNTCRHKWYIKITLQTDMHSRLSLSRIAIILIQLAQLLVLMSAVFAKANMGFWSYLSSFPNSVPIAFNALEELTCFIYSKNAANFMSNTSSHFDHRRLLSSIYFFLHILTYSWHFLLLQHSEVSKTSFKHATPNLITTSNMRE